MEAGEQSTSRALADNTVSPCSQSKQSQVVFGISYQRLLIRNGGKPPRQMSKLPVQPKGGAPNPVFKQGPEPDLFFAGGL